MAKLLDQINYPSDLRKFEKKDLKQISEEQINRVIEDKSFTNDMAKEIINYEPLSFEEGISKEINEYLM